MIETLAVTGTGTCKNCQRPITRLTARADDLGHWTHDSDGRGGYVVHCHDAPIAEPALPTPGGESE